MAADKWEGAGRYSYPVGAPEHMTCKKCGSPIIRGMVLGVYYMMACSNKKCDNAVKPEPISQFYSEHQLYELKPEELDNDEQVVCPACGLGEKGPERMPVESLNWMCMGCGLEFDVIECDVAKYSSRRKEDVQRD